jgi:zinc protease
VEIERPGKVEKNVYKGREERSLVYLAWFTPAVYSEALSAEAAVLNEYLDIRLIREVREKRGGVYSVSPSVSAALVPRGELSLGVYYLCDPRRVRELSDAIEEEVREISLGRIEDDGFAKAVEALKKNWEEQVQHNSYIARNYAYYTMVYDLPLSTLENLPRRYEAVTKADMQKMAASLLTGGPARIILYPESSRE